MRNQINAMVFLLSITSIAFIYAAMIAIPVMAIVAGIVLVLKLFLII